MQAVVAVARVLLAAILIGAGALKVGNPAALAAAIAGFRLLPSAVIPLLALVLAPFEIILGLYLGAGLFTRAAGTVTAATCVLYAGAIASAAARGIPADCGCFGPSEHATADWPHAGLDLALALIAVLVAARAPGLFALDRKWNRM